LGKLDGGLGEKIRGELRNPDCGNKKKTDTRNRIVISCLKCHFTIKRTTKIQIKEKETKRWYERPLGYSNDLVHNGAQSRAAIRTGRGGKVPKEK